MYLQIQGELLRLPCVLARIGNPRDPTIVTTNTYIGPQSRIVGPS